MPKLALSALLVLALAGCTPPYRAPPVYGGQTQQSAGLENSDRINRFRRLAGLSGMAQPAIDQRMATPGQAPGLTQALPVVHLVFEEGGVFDPGSPVLRREASPMLDIVADSMRRDVPDAQLTLLGHTDNTGDDAANNALSLRRAQAVFQALVDRGVNAGGLSTVAIGANQPVASNATAAGRARNRRVEFLISADMAANLAVVCQLPARVASAARGPGVRAAAPPRTVRVPVVRTAVYTGPADVSEAAPQGAVRLQTIGSIALQEDAPGQVTINPTRGS